MTDYGEDSGNFVLHGAVVYSTAPDRLEAFRDAYVVCVDGISKGVFTELPGEYRDLPVVDAWDKLIMPGLVDLHTHAPQFQYRGNGMDMELLEWLAHCIFPEEAKYSNPVCRAHNPGMHIRDD